VIGARAAMLVIAEQYLWLAEGAKDKARSAGEAQRSFLRCPRSRSYPDLVDAGDLIFVNRIGEWPSANSINIAAAIEQSAGCFDGLLGRSHPHEVIRSGLYVSDEPGHGPC
jgi:hypothetical protein